MLIHGVIETPHGGDVSFSPPQDTSPRTHVEAAVCGTQNLDEVQVHENLVMVLSPRDSWDPYDFVLELANEDGESGLQALSRKMSCLIKRWDNH